MDFHHWVDSNGVVDFCRDAMNNSCQDVTNRSFQVVIQRSNTSKLQTEIWNRHSDCKQFRLSYAETCDHDSAWSSIITRNGIVIDSVCVRNFIWFCGLTTNPFSVCKLLAFDQCVTSTFLCQDCMNQVQNDVRSIHAGMIMSVVGSTLWGITGFFHLLNWISTQISLFMSYQLRMCHLLKLMFAGDIVFFRWFAVSTMTHVHCDTNTHIRFQSDTNAQHCNHCQRCQTSTISRFPMLSHVTTDHCIGFRIKVQQHNIEVVQSDQIHVPNITWWIDLPKDYPIGEASNPGPE